MKEFCRLADISKPHVYKIVEAGKLQTFATANESKIDGREYLRWRDFAFRRFMSKLDRAWDVATPAEREALLKRVEQRKRRDEFGYSLRDRDWALVLVNHLQGLPVDAHPVIPSAANLGQHTRQPRKISRIRTLANLNS